MHTSLNEIERRVLGSLMEKSMANPEYYPMTENALVAACNQKQNRDPLMELDGDAVWAALDSLRQLGLVTVLLPGPGARTKRFKHEVETHYGWPKRERAVMAELLLRGPQTAGELRTRCTRFVPFDDLDAVNLVIENLAQRDPPMVATLPREPGRSALRVTHLLYSDGECPTTRANTPITHAPAPPPAAHDEASGSRIDALEAQLARIEQALAGLTTRIAQMETRLP